MTGKGGDSSVLTFDYTDGSKGSSLGGANPDANPDNPDEIFKHGYTYAEWMSLTPTQQAQIEEDFIEGILNDMSSKTNIEAIIHKTVVALEFLAKQTAETYNDDVAGVLMLDFTPNKYEKALQFSPYTSWQEMCDDYYYNIFNIVDKAGRTTKEFHAWHYECWMAFLDWMKKEFGLWARVDEGWDGFVEGVGSSIGNLIGGFTSGLAEGMMPILLIGGVIIIAVVVFAGSKRGGQTAENVGKASGKKGE
ncbi:MAG: hypothetical protein E3J43_06605 [Candidatus Heimdallarchaeota archaeon]|nr:MAG: hypothetical protein E3J43_06605 [Candidatus Heimdallarchaeota archaeon]